MDFNDLIPVFMALVFFLVLAIKIMKFKKSIAEKPKKKQTGTDTRPKKKSPWSQILGDLATQVKTQIEAQKKAAEKEPLLKRLLKSGKPVTKSKPVVIWEKNQELPTPPKTAPKPVPQPRPEAKEPLKQDVTGQDFDDTHEEKAIKAEPRPFAKSMTLADAVVWSEILGPPLALRQEEKHLHDF